MCNCLFSASNHLRLAKNWTDILRKITSVYISNDLSQLQPSCLKAASVLRLHTESYEEKAIQYWLLLLFSKHLSLSVLYFFTDSLLQNLILCCAECSGEQTKIHTGENPSVHLMQVNPKASPSPDCTFIHTLHVRF